MLLGRLCRETSDLFIEPLLLRGNDLIHLGESRVQLLDDYLLSLHQAIRLLLLVHEQLLKLLDPLRLLRCLRYIPVVLGLVCGGGHLLPAMHLDHFLKLLTVLLLLIQLVLQRA